MVCFLFMFLSLFLVPYGATLGIHLGVKKKLKILLRPGESERRPGLYWPKELKKEPVQVVRVRV